MRALRDAHVEVTEKPIHRRFLKLIEHERVLGHRHPPGIACLRGLIEGLVAGGFVHRRWSTMETLGNKDAGLFSLTNKGRRYLAAAEVEAMGCQRP